MDNKELIEKRLLDIRPDIQADGADFQIVEVTDDGIVTLKIKGSKNNKPRTRETLKRLLDYVLRNDSEIELYQKIEMIVWETPREKGFKGYFKNLF
ncbi:NifU family protein [Clostridia bacterium]|nr:NifU family protein [Clostridia bacterium]